MMREIIFAFTPERTIIITMVLIFIIMCGVDIFVRIKHYKIDEQRIINKYSQRWIEKYNEIIQRYETIGNEIDKLTQDIKTIDEKNLSLLDKELEKETDVNQHDWYE